MKCFKFRGALTLGLTALGLTTSTLLSLGAAQPVGAVDVPLELGSIIDGTLEAGDQQLAVDGSYYDVYTFNGTAGQQVIIRMTSQTLDSYLVLLDPTGNSLIQDDDGGGNLDAQIVYTLPVNGRYTIYANAYSANQTGAYRLEVQTATAATAPPPVSTQPRRYFCDEDTSTPVTRARRKDGAIGPLIEWTSGTTLPNTSSSVESCRDVANNLEEIHTRLGRNFAITAGTLNGQPVVCAGTARGVCDPDGEILTANSSNDARQYAIQIVTAIRALQELPPILPEDNTPLAIVPQFDFLDLLSYSNCLEDVIRLHQNPAMLTTQGRRSNCLPDIFARYTNGISRSQALEIITAADVYATGENLDSRLYPPRGQRARIQQIFGFTYSIDQR